jgi:hypothetical protein
MDEYVIPSGRFRGRLLGSLTPAERTSIRRTRVAELQHARLLLDQPAVPPGPVLLPPVEDPTPVVPLPLARIPRPRWPPERSPAPIAPQYIQVRVLKYVICLVIILLVHPPLAQIPGRLVGSVLRVIALRCRDVWGHFVGSFVSEMSDIGWDFLEWIETTVLPFPKPLAAEVPVPGQRLGTVVLGLFTLRMLRPWQ